MRISSRRWFWIWIETRLPALGQAIVGGLLTLLLGWLVLAVGGSGCGTGWKSDPGGPPLLLSAGVLGAGGLVPHPHPPPPPPSPQEPASTPSTASCRASSPRRRRSRSSRRRWLRRTTTAR